MYEDKEMYCLGRHDLEVSTVCKRGYGRVNGLRPSQSGGFTQARVGHGNPDSDGNTY